MEDCDITKDLCLLKNKILEIFSQLELCEDFSVSQEERLCKALNFLENSLEILSQVSSEVFGTKGETPTKKCSILSHNGKEIEHCEKESVEVQTESKENACSQKEDSGAPTEETSQDLEKLGVQSDIERTIPESDDCSVRGRLDDKSEQSQDTSQNPQTPEDQAKPEQSPSTVLHVSLMGNHQEKKRRGRPRKQLKGSQSKPRKLSPEGKPTFKGNPRRFSFVDVGVFTPGFARLKTARKPIHFPALSR